MLTFMTQCDAVPIMVAKPGIPHTLLLGPGLSFVSEKRTSEEAERTLATARCWAAVVRS